MESSQKTVVRKRRPKPRLEDRTQTDLHLLGKAYGLNDEQFMCFGTSGFRLEALGLISEGKITYSGRVFLWELSRNEKAKKVSQ